MGCCGNAKHDKPIETSVIAKRNQFRKADSVDKLKIPSNQFIKHNKAELNDQYEILEKIGDGTFGEAHKVRSKLNKTFRAMKTIFKNRIDTNANEGID
jgi:hypothetical protein